MRKTVPAREDTEEQQPPQSPKSRSSEPEQPTPTVPPSPPPPQLHRYRANVEITTRQVIPVEVEATSAKEAAQFVKEKVAQLQPDLATATIKKRASEPKKV